MTVQLNLTTDILQTSVCFVAFAKLSLRSYQMCEMHNSYNLESNWLTIYFIPGVCFSSSLKWNSHFDSEIKRASKRIFMKSSLRKSDVSPTPGIFMSRAYEYVEHWSALQDVYMQHVLLYTYPCRCDAPKFLIDKLLRVERRVSWMIILLVPHPTVCWQWLLWKTF